MAAKKEPLSLKSIVCKIKANTPIEVTSDHKKDLDEIKQLEEQNNKNWERIRELNGKVKALSKKVVRDKYKGKMVVINGDWGQDTDHDDPSFDKFRICKVKSTEVSAGRLILKSDLTITVNDEDKWWKSVVYDTAKNHSHEIYNEACVKILTKKEALEILNCIDILDSNYIGKMIQSVE